MLRALLCLLPALASAAPVSQWVWSRRDADVLESVRTARADVGAATSVAELGWTGAVTVSLRLSPRLVPGATWVVRLNDSLHGAWGDPTLAAQVDAALARVLKAGQGTRRIQLDYDCPTARLTEYATLLAHLRRNALAGSEVWVTSLVSHLRRVDYGPTFRGVVDGHVVQLFDTGDLPSAAAARALAADLARAEIPFAIGLGAFERASTDHHGWLPHLATLAVVPGFGGTFIFPAGRAWSRILGSLP